MNDNVTRYPRLYSQQPDDRPLLTIFTVLKPFEGEADLHQRNALASWSALAPDVEVLLFSDSDFPVDISSRFTCFRLEERSEQGAPLLNEAFKTAAERAQGRVRAYLNGDIIIDRRFVDAVRRLVASDLPSWVAIGRRTDCPAPFDEPALLSRQTRAGDLFSDTRRRGQPASIMCKDYFVFTPDRFRDLPPFAVGRGNWDNWMVSSSKSEGVPVIDIGLVAPVIHPMHGYRHVPGGRLSAYVTGDEARENQRLAGGRRLIHGSTATFRLSKTGIHRISMPVLSIIRDLPSLRLLLELARSSLFQRQRVAVRVAEKDTSSSEPLGQTA